MKFNQTTLALLKNFASINPSIQFKQGNLLRTISPQKSILASAQIEENIDSTFAIYDLPRFLGVLSLFDEPEVVVEANYLTVKSGRQKVRYLFTDPSMITVPPEKQIKLPTVDVEFDISAENLSKIMKAMSAMQLTQLSITGEEGRILLQATSPTIKDSFSLDVGETDKVFNVVLRSENLKMAPAGYKAEVSKSKLIHLMANHSNLEYWLACESDSTFD